MAVTGAGGHLDPGGPEIAHDVHRFGRHRQGGIERAGERIAPLRPARIRRPLLLPQWRQKQRRLEFGISAPW